MTTISLRDVSVLAPAPLFRNLNLSIGDGERLGLVAGNGAGKTTLLRCIAGLIEWAGYWPDNWKVHRGGMPK